MGLYGSKGIISPQNAEASLGAQMVARLEQAWRRMGDGRGVDSKAFHQYVLAAFPLMPKLLVERLFTAFDASGKGVLSLQDLVCGVAILSEPSTPGGGPPSDNQLQFLFQVYDGRRSGVVERSMLKSMLLMAYPREEGAATRVETAINRLFRNTRRLYEMECQEFVDCCASARPGELEPLWGWLHVVAGGILREPHPSVVALDQKYNPDRELAKVGRKYHLGNQALQDLKFRYDKICQRNGGTRLELGWWLEMAQVLVHDAFAQRIFEASAGSSGNYWTAVDFVEFGCRTALKRSKSWDEEMRNKFWEDQMRFLFNLFDEDRDGLLREEEVADLLETLAWHHMHRDNRPTPAHPLHATPNNHRHHSFTGGGREGSLGSLWGHVSPGPGGAPGRTRSRSNSFAKSLQPSPVVRRASESMVGALESRRQTANNGYGYGVDKLGVQADWSDDLLGIARAVIEEMAKTAASATALLPQDAAGAAAAGGSPGFGVNGSVASSFARRGLTFGGYLAWSAVHSGRTQILKDLLFICAMEFAMRPPQPSDEKDVIFEVRRQYHQSLPPQSKGRQYELGEVGTSWYLVAQDWWDNWCRYTRFPNPHNDPELDSGEPRGINNSSLLLRSGTRPETRQLADGIIRGMHYELLAPRAWEALVAWYGGGPALERKMVLNQGRIELELYPCCFLVAQSDPKGQPRQTEREFLFSRAARVSDLLRHLCGLVRVEMEAARLWDYRHRDDWRKQLVLPLDRTLEDCRLETGQLVLLEIAQQDGSWPRSQLQAQLEAQDEALGAPPAGELQGGTLEIGDGLVGMNNMGNTCYINSSIQCLSHTPLLTEYFLKNAYLSDINLANKDGTQGELAHKYAHLVLELWSRSKKAVNPKMFKNAIAKFNDQFGGNDQHDAQELLAFLLNGLNEDLNRIENKPYIPQPDSDGRPDHELADIWWKNHLLRDFSIVVALFAGQFKSLLTCQECGYESARFEPFMFLQLPLPEDTLRTVHVILVLVDGSKRPAKCSVRVPKTGTVRDVVHALVELFNSPLPPLKGDGPRGGGAQQDRVEGQVARREREGGGGSKHLRGPPADVVRDADTSEDGTRSDASACSEDAYDEEDRAYSELNLQERNLIVAEVTAYHRVEMSNTRLDVKLADVRDQHSLYVFEVESWAPPRAAQAPGGVPALQPAGGATGGPAGGVEESPAPGDVAASPQGLPAVDEVEGWEDGRGGGSRLDDSPDRREAYRSRGGAGGGSSSAAPPLKHTSHSEIDNDDSEAGALALPPRPRRAPSPLPPGRLLFFTVHRHLEHVNTFFVNPYRFLLSGTPLVCTAPLDPPLTGRQLYDRLHLRFRRFIKAEVPAPANRSPLRTLHRKRPLEEDAEPADDPPGPTLLTSEAAAAGPVNRWGFRLRLVTASALVCGRCHWSKGCAGCVIPPLDQPCGVQDLDTVAVDWHMQVYKERYDDVEAQRCHMHWSIQRNLGLENESLSLAKCMDTFTKEEKIPEVYCSGCKKLNDARSKMDIWRLPPVLVIHLKRFQYTTYSRRKLRNLVEFPVNGLDLSPYVVKDDGGAPRPPPASNGTPGPGDPPVSDQAVRSTNGEHRNSNGTDKLRKPALGASASEATTAAQGNGGSDVGHSDVAEAGRSLMSPGESPPVSGGLSALPRRESLGMMSSLDGRAESLYDLYACIHHLGALSAGHYVASVRSKPSVPGGPAKWHYFNDNQVSAIDEADLVSPSAYILFYVRRDMAHVRIEDVYPIERNGSLSEAEIEQMIKQRDAARCSLM